MRDEGPTSLYSLAPAPDISAPLTGSHFDFLVRTFFEGTKIYTLKHGTEEDNENTRPAIYATFDTLFRQISILKDVIEDAPVSDDPHIHLSGVADTFETVVSYIHTFKEESLKKAIEKAETHLEQKKLELQTHIRNREYGEIAAHYPDQAGVLLQQKFEAAVNTAAYQRDHYIPYLGIPRSQNKQTKIIADSTYAAHQNDLFKEDSQRWGQGVRQSMGMQIAQNAVVIPFHGPGHK